MSALPQCSHLLRTLPPQRISGTLRRLRLCTAPESVRRTRCRSCRTTATTTTPTKSVSISKRMEELKHQKKYVLTKPACLVHNDHVQPWLLCLWAKDLRGCIAVQKCCRTAFIPFLMAGDPDLATTSKAIEILDRLGADIIELGMPYSVSMHQCITQITPVDDGPQHVIGCQQTRVLWTRVHIAGPLGRWTSDTGCCNQSIA